MSFTRLLSTSIFRRKKNRFAKQRNKPGDVRKIIVSCHVGDDSIVLYPLSYDEEKKSCKTKKYLGWLSLGWSLNCLLPIYSMLIFTCFGICVLENHFPSSIFSPDTIVQIGCTNNPLMTRRAKVRFCKFWIWNGE